MNDVMSVGVHRLWKSQFVSHLAPGPDVKMVDVAGTRL
jgi:demethylmenaquinone methyltransferase/2-methoxy-6-polyprenyl-1,4-benzoquinol methylase